MLCLVGLAACGGNTVAQKSDEELIKEDIATTIGTNVTKEEIAKGMREDAELQQLEQLGLDIDSYAENIAGKFEVNTESVKVDGDTAVGTLFPALTTLSSRALSSTTPLTAPSPSR